MSNSQQEYRLGLMQEITEKKLLGAIEERCDNIEEEVKSFHYSAWGYITEQLNEILDLVKIAEEDFLGLRLKVKLPETYKHEPITAEQIMDTQTSAGIVEMLTDETLKNAIIAYNAMTTDRYNRGDAKEITIAYLQAKGRADLAEDIREATEEKL